MSRIEACFKRLKDDRRAAFIPFLTAGDPDQKTSFELMKGLNARGADLIELGMPFSDPSADGPTIEKASMRALKSGARMTSTFEMIKEFRKTDDKTPIILMGYINPILAYGPDTFMADAKSAGVDGLILVDLPPEEDEDIRGLAEENGIHIIRLVTPTTDDDRLSLIARNASGFLYYVAVAGVTGQKSATEDDISAAVARIRAKTDLPIAVGFGIKTPEQVRTITSIADAAVVGSAIVSKLESELDENGHPRDSLVPTTLDFVKLLTSGIKAG